METPSWKTRRVLSELSLSSSPHLNSPRSPLERKPRTTAHIRRVSLSKTISPLPRLCLPRLLSISSVSSSASSTSNSELGGPDRPILHFRPQLWKHLDRDRQNLNLDLFWPVALSSSGSDDDEEETPGLFPVKSLEPLCDFHDLRSLQINGMLQSYQRLIWQTCWASPNLLELVLGMVLEPDIGEEHKHEWPAIGHRWRSRNVERASTHYLGHEGEGVLNEAYGDGEYLDQRAIATGRVHALNTNNFYLPIVRLVLSGFVVDAGPFFRWFNPARLREIEFKSHCVDAGFALPQKMKSMVTISCPEPTECNAVKMTKVKPEDIQLVHIRKKAKKKIAVRRAKSRHGKAEERVTHYFSGQPL